MSGVELVAADLMSKAQAGDGDAFRELTEPHRRELQVPTAAQQWNIPRVDPPEPISRTACFPGSGCRDRFRAGSHGLSGWAPQEGRVAGSALSRPVSARLIRGTGALVPVPDVPAG